MDLRKIIKKEIEKQSLPYVELARRIGISDQTISNYLTGRSQLKSDNLEKLLDALKIKVR
jgi:transcriptional regulator with XRE-family HTH domain